MLARWRGVPIRDANRRWRIVPMQNSSLITRNRLELIVAFTLGGIVSVIGVFRGWLAAPLWCVPIMAVLFAKSTHDRLKPLAIAHRRLSIRNDECPWCASRLASIEHGEKRACPNCPGDWWDVAGLEAGTSPRQHLRRRVVYNTFAALVGLLLGFLVCQVAGSLDIVGAAIGYCLLLVFALAAAHAYAKRFASPIVFAAALAVPSVIAAVAWMISGDVSRSPIVALLGVGVGAAAYVMGNRAVRERPRDIVHGRGRECARCSYDLRMIAEGKPCPECGSYERVR